MRSDYYIDMHTHILPGVDDGSHDNAMSAAMLDVAYKEGIQEMIVTPHNKADRRCVSRDGIDRRIDLLYELAEKAGYDMRFYPGNECMYDSTLPDRLSAGEVCTMADSNYVLIEFSPNDQFRYIREGLRRVSYEGYQPILAHCERYLCLLKDVDKAIELAKSGVLLQCNAHGVKPKLFARNPETKFIKALLDDQLVSFISTDAHRPEGRAPFISETAEYLYRHYDEAYVNALLHDNADKLITGGEI